MIDSVRSLIQAQLESVAAECRAAGAPNVDIYVTDLSDGGQIDALALVRAIVVVE